MVHPLSSAYMIENCDHVVFAANAGKPENRLAQHFLRRISKDALSAPIPAGDGAFYRLSDDRVVGRFNDCRQQLQPFKFGSGDDKFLGRTNRTLARRIVIGGHWIHGTSLYSFSPKLYVKRSWRVASET
jgi:hypothetical protein